MPRSISGIEIQRRVFQVNPASLECAIEWTASYSNWLRPIRLAASYSNGPLQTVTELQHFRTEPGASQEFTGKQTDWALCRKYRSRRFLSANTRGQRRYRFRDRGRNVC